MTGCNLSVGTQARSIVFPTAFEELLSPFSPPRAFMWGSLSEHAFPQGFRRIQPRGEKPRCWAPKTERDPPLACFQVTPSHIPSTHPGHKLEAPTVGCLCGHQLTGDLWLSATSARPCASDPIHAPNCCIEWKKFMEECGKIKEWMGGCGWYALIYSHNCLLLGGWAALVVSLLSLTQPWL